jgi:hypothetical protein
MGIDNHNRQDKQEDRPETTESHPHTLALSQVSHLLCLHFVFSVFSEFSLHDCDYLKNCFHFQLFHLPSDNLSKS